VGAAILVWLLKVARALGTTVESLRDPPAR
jgi:hypothetical protein